MKHFFFVFWLVLPVISVVAQDEGLPPPEVSPPVELPNDLPQQPILPLHLPFTWDVLYAGSWEESKTLHNRGDARLSLELFGSPGLVIRGQAIDKRTLNFELDPALGDAPWGDPKKAITSGAVGLYHKATGSRLLYGVLDEWGLPARIRSPWIRSAPYAENHKPIMADLRTSVSSTKKDEAYLYLSSPRLIFFEEAEAAAATSLPALPIAVRGFASGQFTPEGGSAASSESNCAPAFSGGLETLLGKKIELLLEGFYTDAKLPARTSKSWFSDPAPLPARDFRLGAAALMLNVPYVSVASDWAWSETFAWGSGVYGNGGIRLTPPLPWTAGKPGPWSLSLAADSITERYISRDGSSPGSSLRTAGKIEWKGPRSGLFRVNTTLRGPNLDAPFNRSSSGIYYRFPAPRAGGAASGGGNGTGSGNAGFPLRITRISLNADRNATNLKKIHDGIDGTLGLSLNLPPLSLPLALLPSSAKDTARKIKNLKPKSYPLGINFYVSVDEVGHADETSGSHEPPAPYPFFPANMAAPEEFDSAKTHAELLWSPGIFQFRTRWGYTAYAKKDNQWDGSVSAAVRFKHGRFSVKFAWPAFPDKWNCTLAWRFNYADKIP